MKAPIDNTPGSYALVLQCHQPRSAQVGKWGELECRPGFYIYVGSAFGPGGLRARVGRHFRDDKKLRWHIDYLRAVSSPVGAWLSDAGDNLEHHWAGVLADSFGFAAIAGFGCSDCRCHSHLFHTRRLPVTTSLRKATGSPLYWLAATARP